MIFIFSLTYRITSDENVYLESQNSIYTFKHTYEINNFGPSAVQTGMARFHIPEILANGRITFGLKTVKVFYENIDLVDTLE